MPSIRVVLSAVLCALSTCMYAGQGTLDSLSAVLASEDAKSVLAFANSMVEDEPAAAAIAFGIAESKAAESPLILIDIWRDRGFALEDQGSVPQAIVFYEKALLLARNTKDKIREITLLNDLAIASRKARAYEEAKNYHLSCLNLAHELDNAEYIEYALHGLGYLYESVGDFKEALNYYEKSREEAEKRNDKQGEIITLSNIAHAYVAQKDTINARKTIKKAWDLALLHSTLQRQAHVAFNYGEIQEDLGDWLDAERMFHAAEMRYGSGGDMSSEVEAAFRLARIYYKKKEHNRAYAQLQKYKSKIHLLPSALQIQNLQLLGQVVAELQKFKTAETYFQNAFKLAKVDSSKSGCYEALKGLAFCSEKLGNAAQALIYLEQSNAYRDEYAEHLLTEDNKELNFRFGLEKTEMALQGLQFRQNRIQTIVISVLGVFVAFVLAWILYFRKRNNRLLSQKNKEIREQNEQLESSNQFLHQFTYAVAHDMKEPLRTINGFTTLLERKYGDRFEKEGKAYMGFLRSGVERMHELVTSFLAFNTISKETAAHMEADADAVFEEARTELMNSHKNAVINKTSSLGMVCINRDHLRHLFKQVIHNGIKFNSAEQPTVLVTSEQVENNRIRFGIHDNGIGIRQEYETKIFNLFQQLDKDSAYGGVGIGLTLSKNIVEKYDGKIWFEADTRLGGTVFWVELPSV